MSKKELKEKIKKELNESGFPLEIFCRKAILSHGFWITESQYFDDPEGIVREIDVEGFIDSFWIDGTVENRLLSWVIVECKKNKQHPWVFFRQDSIFDLNFTSEGNTLTKKQYFSLFYKNKNKHHYKSIHNTSKKYIVPFCNPNSKDHRQIYDSIINVVRYCEFEQKKKKRLRKNKKLNYTDIYYPTIVFDGNLFVAYDTQKENMGLKEVNHVLVKLTQEDSDANIQKHYSIDIVRKTFFGKYLLLLKKDHKVIENLLKI